jgi:hypothetical protein
MLVSYVDNVTSSRTMTALEVGLLAQRLVNDYVTFVALMDSALHPDSALRVPLPEPGHFVGVGYVRRKKGEPYAYYYAHYLSQSLESADVQREEISRVWLSGALITLGDALTAESYFEDNAPELQLVRHMRNAVAHGNQFRIDTGALRLPAHNRLAFMKGFDNHSEFEITAELHGQAFLFDWMEPGDVLDVFHSVSMYLIRKGNGDHPIRNW